MNYSISRSQKLRPIKGFFLATLLSVILWPAIIILIIYAVKNFSSISPIIFKFQQFVTNFLELFGGLG